MPASDVGYGGKCEQTSCPVFGTVVTRKKHLQVGRGSVHEQSKTDEIRTKKAITNQLTSPRFEFRQIVGVALS